jgi:hypothetical protein
MLDPTLIPDKWYVTFTSRAKGLPHPTVGPFDTEVLARAWQQTRPTFTGGVVWQHTVNTQPPTGPVTLILSPGSSPGT